MMGTSILNAKLSWQHNTNQKKHMEPPCTLRFHGWWGSGCSGYSSCFDDLHAEIPASLEASLNPQTDLHPGGSRENSRNQRSQFNNGGPPKSQRSCAKFCKPRNLTTTPDSLTLNFKTPRQEAPSLGCKLSGASCAHGLGFGFRV